MSHELRRVDEYVCYLSMNQITTPSKPVVYLPTEEPTCVLHSGIYRTLLTALLPHEGLGNK